jgi:four helix bundle protein
MTKRFEDLEVWKRSSRLAVEIYNSIRESREYSLKDQLTRAAVSIPSNIAEGAERFSNKEFLRFLYIARGSAAELRTQLYIAKKIGMVEVNKANAYLDEVKQISAMLQGLVKSLKL